MLCKPKSLCSLLSACLKSSLTACLKGLIYETPNLR